MLTTRKVAWLALVARVAQAQSTEAITDLSIFQLLAPCASIAVSSQVRAFDDSTQLGCGTSASELQSCICSQEHVSSSVASNISSVVESRCGSRASDDQWSASQVLRQYCKTKETITFATPTAHTVTDYITDVDKMDYLAPCAYSALSLAVMYSPSAHCPASASTLYNACVCQKKDVVELIRSEFSSRIANSCQNREDVGFAADFYDEYCALNNGTSSFAPIPTPPGDMTYYITGLPAFSALKECGRSAISSAVLDKTTRLCPDGPQALASCICIKEGMVHDVYADMTAKVKGRCGYDDDDTVNSAIDVFNYYCSAAEGKVTTKVTDTARQKYPTAVGGAGVEGGPGPTQTDARDGDNRTSGGDSVAPGVIAGAVVGSVVGIALIVGGTFWFLRHRKINAAEKSTLAASDGNDFTGGGAELEDRSKFTTPRQEMDVPSPRLAPSELSGVTQQNRPHGPGPEGLSSNRNGLSDTRYELEGQN
ncbi:hypothetical protein CC79DRAFT_146151 [Sarocladium strictum]